MWQSEPPIGCICYMTPTPSVHIGKPYDGDGRRPGEWDVSFATGENADRSAGRLSHFAREVLTFGAGLGSAASIRDASAVDEADLASFAKADRLSRGARSPTRDRFAREEIGSMALP